MMISEEIGNEQMEKEALSPPFVIRPMQEQDIPAVMVIERRSFPSPWPESAYRYELRSRADSRFYVLQRRREPPPTAWHGRLRNSSWEEEPPLLGYMGLRFRGKTAHICTIAVHPRWRRRGTGRFLLLEALAEALRCGARRVTLEVRPSNLAALKLYTGVGFVQVGLRRAYYRDGEDGSVMALEPLDETFAARLRELRREAEARLAHEIT